MPAAPSFQPRTARAALSVFFLSGLLLSFPGAILPAWGYHVRDGFLEIAAYFLAMCAGLLVSVRASGILTKSRGTRFVVVLGSGLAAGGLIELALAGPPVAWGWRAGGLLVIGIAGGLLNRAAFQSISSIYQRDRAATLNLAGVIFGLGCLMMAVFISSAFYVYTVASTLILAALIPGFAAGLYARSEFPPPVPHPHQPWREVWHSTRSPATVLFSLLLFFQFGNEWTVAGWLALFLVRRVGMSPDDSLTLLAAYWLALLVGRVAAQALLPRVGHGKLLTSSAAAAMLGSLVLMTTNNRGGAWAGVLMLGGGFALIYPLAAERIGGRFPDYHPGFYNGIFSLAVTGGLLAPLTVAVAAHFWGIWTVMALPMLGTIAVFLLTVAIWVEARLSAGR